MRLSLQHYAVSKLQFGASTTFREGVLTVDRNELLHELSRDRKLKGIDLEIVSPGTSARISNILDALEPRVKVDSKTYFPGLLSPLVSAGTGLTNVLRGAVVLEIGSAPEFIGGLVDMIGPAAELTPLAKSHNLCVIGHPWPEMGAIEFSKALKKASMQASVYLAAATVGIPPDSVEVLDLDIPACDSESGGDALPKVAYLMHVNSVGDLREPLIYGDNPIRYYPTVLHPNEVIDGAVVSGHYEVGAGFKNFTYALTNNPVVMELYRRHGTELDFRGVVVAPEPVSLTDMRRTAMMAANLLKHVLGAEGVIMTKETGGHTDVVLMESCDACEKAGIRTLLVDNEWLKVDGTGDAPLIAFIDAADAMVSVGNIEAMLDLPAVDTVVGGDRLAGIGDDLHRPVVAPIFAVANGISQVGLTHLTTERR
ncbi:MAG: glycine reductase [Thermoleophilia bacterium]|nr:glycine reductase [Thermoleophilia bacterium]